MSQSVAGNRFVIGYALSPQKVGTFMKDSLVIYARERGVDLVPVNLDKPLVEQGPFDCIIHKLYDTEWRKRLEEFSLHNPITFIIDPMDDIDRLLNRVTMLHVVNELRIENLATPLQVLVSDHTEYSLQELKYPVIAKPLIAEGAADSHQMFLVLNKTGLLKLDRRPIVLQEFVNHGGVIFKVYVAGEHVKCVKRRSLPDQEMGTSGNLMLFSQISHSAESDEVLVKLMEATEMPPLSFINEVANELRDALKLHLFNFDMLRDGRDGDNRFLIVDINYLPGYAKVPHFENMLTDFFLDIAHKQRGRF